MRIGVHMKEDLLRKIIKWLSEASEEKVKIAYSYIKRLLNK